MRRGGEARLRGEGGEGGEGCERVEGCEEAKPSRAFSCALRGPISTTPILPQTYPPDIHPTPPYPPPPLICTPTSTPRIDYTSIPQRNKASQLMSIESLPVYAAFSRFFVVIAPPVTHDGNSYNHWTYSKRGWCRLEQWARIAQCGVENMYVCHGDGAEKPLVSFSANAPVLSVAADVMGGEFTVAHDRVKLVDVMVQLYHQLQTLPGHLSRGDAIEFLRTYVQSNRERLFPKEIFRDYIQLVEREAFYQTFCSARGGASASASTRQTFMDYGVMPTGRRRKVSGESILSRASETLPKQSFRRPRGESGAQRQSGAHRDSRPSGGKRQSGANPRSGTVSSDRLFGSSGRRSSGPSDKAPDTASETERLPQTAKRTSSSKIVFKHLVMRQPQVAPASLREESVTSLGS